MQYDALTGRVIFEYHGHQNLFGCADQGGSMSRARRWKLAAFGIALIAAIVAITLPGAIQYYWANKIRYSGAEVFYVNDSCETVGCFATPVRTWLPRDLYEPVSHVSLTGPEYGDDALRDVCHLTSLRRLSIDRATITNDGLESLTSLPHLESLSIWQCSFPPNQTLRIPHLPNLRVLGVCKGTVDDEMVDAITGMPRLVILDLYWMEIPDRLLAKLMTCPSLSLLGLKHSGIRDESLNFLVDSKTLKILDVNENNISDDGIAALSKLKQLDELHIASTRITPEGHQKLTRSLPNTNIFYD